MIAFYNSFQKIELNCDKENMLILNTRNFQKKMLSVLISSLNWQNVFLKTGLGLKTAEFWKFYKTCRNIYLAEFTVKEVTVFRDVARPLQTKHLEGLNLLYIINFSNIFDIGFYMSNFLFSTMSYCKCYCRWSIKHARPCFGQEDIHNGI